MTCVKIVIFLVVRKTIIKIINFFINIFSKKKKKKGFGKNLVLSYDIHYKLTSSH